MKRYEEINKQMTQEPNLRDQGIQGLEYKSKPNINNNFKLKIILN